MRRSFRSSLVATAVAATSLALVPTAAHADPTGTVLLAAGGESPVPNEGWLGSASASTLSLWGNDGPRIFGDDGSLLFEVPESENVIGVSGDKVAYTDYNSCLHVADLTADTDTNIACDSGNAVIGPDRLVYTAWDEATEVYKAYSRTLSTGTTTLISADADADGFGYPRVGGPDGFLTSTYDYDPETDTYTQGIDYRTWATPQNATSLALAGNDNQDVDCSSISSTQAACSVYDYATDTATGRLAPLNGSAATTAPYGIILAGGDLQAWSDDSGEAWTIKDAGGTATIGNVASLVAGGDTFVVQNFDNEFRRYTGRATSTVIPVDLGMAPIEASDISVGTGRVAWGDNSSADGSLWSRTLTRSGSTLTAGATGSPIAQGVTTDSITATGPWTIYGGTLTNRVVRDGTSRALGGAGGSNLRASGSRALQSVEVCTSAVNCTSSGRIYDLTRTSERNLSIGWNARLWGDFIAHQPGNGLTLQLNDLATGATRTLATVTEGNSEMWLEGMADGWVVWSVWNYETEDVSYFKASVADGSTPIDITASINANGYIRDVVSGRGIFVEVENYSTGAVSRHTIGWDGVKRSLPAIEAHRVSVRGDVLGWVASADGLPRVAPLNHVAHKPAFLGNLVAPTKVATGASWKFQAQASDALPSCKVEIRNGAAALVRSLNCTAATKVQGEAAVTWNGKDTAGVAVPSGTYTWSLVAANADGPLQNRTNTGDANLTGSITVGTATAPAAPTGAVTVKLAGGTPVVSWPAPPAGTTVMLRRANGLTPPASATAGTEVYAGAGTTVTDLVTENSTYSYSLFHVKDGIASTAKLTRTFQALFAPAIFTSTRSAQASNTLAFPVTWGEGDPSGTKYNVERRTGTGAWTAWLTDTTTRTASFGASGVPEVTVEGGSYSFRATTFDKYGNKSGLSPLKTTRVTRDDRSATFGTGWTAPAVATRYLGTMSNTGTAGAWMTFTSTGTTVAILGDKIASGSQFQVYDGETLLGTFNSYSSYTQPKAVLFSKTFATSATRTIKVVNLATPGKPNLKIDGFDYN